MEAIQAQVTVTISEEKLANLLCCGFEGGVGYWCQIVGYVKPKEPRPIVMKDLGNDVCKYTDYPLTGGAVKCKVVDDDEASKDTLILDGDAIKRGIKIMAEKYPRHFSNVVSENEDAETGDVFIQCCLLGEIVYG